MNGLMEDFNKSGEIIFADLEHIACLLDRIYRALNTKMCSPQVEAYLINSANDLIIDRERLQSVVACLESGMNLSE